MRAAGPARVAIVGGPVNRTSVRLVAEWQALGIAAELLDARTARSDLEAGDVALGRLDVLQTLDGVEPGLLDLLLLERSGRRVLNTAFALLAAHDKMRTAAMLRKHGIPHPRAGLVRSASDPLPVAPPLVVKPRFGSWGVDVHRCFTEAEARAVLHGAAERPWFARHGALVQEYAAAGSCDCRLVVAGGRVIGAAERCAAPGEWRTNVSLGGSRRPVAPDPAAASLACRAAEALGCDLVGVDLLRLADGGLVVLELNGASEFDEGYALAGRDVFADAAEALRLGAGVRARAGLAAVAGDAGRRRP